MIKISSTITGHLDPMVKQAEKIRETLEEEILTGTLRPGDRLEELILAERFKVSRTPIRETLFQLAASGLVETQTRRGTFVTKIGPRQLMEMFDVMAELEGMCARLAARRAEPADLDAIKKAHQSCNAAKLKNSGDDYFYENEIFHAAIRNASHNHFLIEQATVLHKRLRPYRRLQLRTRGRISASFDEHDQVVEAIIAGKEESASKTMHTHIEVQGERFTDLLISIDIT